MTALDIHWEIFMLRMSIAGLQTLAWVSANWLEALAAACGLTGAFLLACKGRFAALGWLAFLASNGLWIVFALRTGLHGLLLQQLGFTVTSVIGAWVWLIRPRLRPKRWIVR